MIAFYIRLTENRRVRFFGSVNRKTGPKTDNTDELSCSIRADALGHCFHAAVKDCNTSPIIKFQKALAPKAEVVLEINEIKNNKDAQIAYENAMNDELKTWKPTKDRPVFKVKDCSWDFPPTRRIDKFEYYD